MRKSLPSRPNFEQLKKQAGDLRKAHQTGEVDAVHRIRTSHPRCNDLSDAEIKKYSFSLQDAQLVVAREYGFPSWPKLVRIVRPSIVIAESDEDIYLLMKQEFEKVGYIVFTSDSSETLFAHLENPQISVLWLSDNLDQGDGLHVLEQVRARFRDLQIIYSLIRIKELEKAMSTGIAGYAIRPFYISEMLEKTMNALQKAADESMYY